MNEIVKGRYIQKLGWAPLATKIDGDLTLVRPTPPLRIQTLGGDPVDEAKFLVSYWKTEEKGTDVNVATRMLRDLYRAEIDAAIVVSNDSDLELPIKFARELIPVGLIRPQRNYLAGALRGDRNEGVGGHWWWYLTPDVVRANQLPDEVGTGHKPPTW